VRTIRIYQPGHYERGQSVALSDAQRLHVGVVLRMRVGDPLILFCGDDREFLALITSIDKKNVVVEIQAVHDVSRESSRAIHLAQAISKGDRMEWVIQKAVELGVASITPLLTEHCVVRLDASRLAKKQAQWQAIAEAACEQSGRNRVPLIHEACTLEAYLLKTPAVIKLILHPKATKSWSDFRFNEGEVALLIGPEGGFSEAEVEQALQQGFDLLSLGPRVLRTETAAIAALSVLQAAIGDL
jgi:16S rRNA (uracil1498-N3)-methyltransferase